jgi:endoglucanase
MGDAVLAHETTQGRGGRVLVAGPWARERGVVNPSYLVTIAMSELWWLTGETRWADVAATSRAVLRTAAGVDTVPRLPPDWSTAAGHPRPAPGDDTARFGYDAARAIVQAVADCDATGRAVARSAWTSFDDVEPDDLRAEYSLDGRPLTTDRHPVVLVAAAAAARAAGHPSASRDLLASADRLHADHPSYYGAAWIAITRLLLDTDALGGCAPSSG